MTRADAGRPRLTRRDMEALEWLEDMRAIYETDLAVLLGRLSGREGGLSPNAVRTTVRRWARLGLATAQKAFAHEPRFIWLTREGARLVGAESWTEPGWAVLRHTALVSRVRLWLERRGLAGHAVTEWLSERRWRQLNQAAVRAGQHVPDGVATTEDGPVAVEVELSDKGPTRTVGIAVRLAQSYPNVVYVVPGQSQTARTVRGALDKEFQHTWRKGDGHVGVLELPADVHGGDSSAGVE